MSITELAMVDEKSVEVNHMRTGRLEDSLYSKELAPHYMKLASQLASSELIPKSFRGKPQDLFICWAMGYQVGLTPEQSQQCIAVINGKPAMWGDDMLALCMAHSAFDDIIETPIMKNESVIGYTCIVKRKGKADKESIFTLDMAKRAGLLAKGGVWNQYPERMLKLRARGFCLRDAFPDALKGIKPREEVEDYIDADYMANQQKDSRTERLKKDILTKQGAVNAETISGLCAPTTYQSNEQEDTEVNQPNRESTVDKETSDLHLEIKRLFEEIGFTQERIDKALDYYEVSNIEDLGFAGAEDFIVKLRNL